MIYFTVYCEDRITKEKVVVQELATRSEACKIVDFMKDNCTSCNIYYVRFDLHEGENVK